MKEILILTTMILVSCSAFAGYSEGYRMGTIDKVSRKGLINKSVEGQMLMGREGTPYSKGSGEGKEIVNPWYFSAEDRMFSAINDSSGYVFVKYEQVHLNLGLSYDTEYLVKEITPVTRKMPTKCNIKTDGVGIKSKGKRSGRIVKATNKGTVIKTFEILIQVGNSGNQFKHMSINDKNLYDCAVEVLQSGKKVDVYYTESHINTSFRETSYTVTKISVPDDI